MSVRFERLIKALETLGLSLGDDIVTEEELATRVELAAENFARGRQQAEQEADSDHTQDDAWYD